MAVMPYAKGMSIYVGFTPNPQWRYYDQFWLQTIVYLGEGRRSGRIRNVLLSTDKQTYVSGETARIQLLIPLSTFFSMHAGKRIYATVVDPLKREYTVLFKGTPYGLPVGGVPFTVNEPGEYFVSITYVKPREGAKGEVLFDEKAYFNVKKADSLQPSA